jgi:hypothetical protein
VLFHGNGGSGPSGKQERADGTICTEYIGRCLEECGVFDGEQRPYKGLYTPRDFVDANRFLAPEWSYGEPLDLEK